LLYSLPAGDDLQTFFTFYSFRVGTPYGYYFKDGSIHNTVTVKLALVKAIQDCGLQAASMQDTQRRKENCRKTKYEE